MLFHKISFVFALEIGSPVDGIFELVAFGDSVFEDLYAFAVGQAHELSADHAFQTRYEGVVVAVVKELDVVAAVVEGVFDEALDEVLGEIHVVLDVVECHLRLYHPELGEVARGVGILGAEGGAEGVDLTHGGRSKLTLELSAHSEAGHLAEEVLAVVRKAFLVLRDIVQVQGRDLEHLAGAFGVRLSDKGSV